MPHPAVVLAGSLVCRVKGPNGVVIPCDGGHGAGDTRKQFVHPAALALPRRAAGRRKGVPEVRAVVGRSRQPVSAVEATLPGALIRNTSRDRKAPDPPASSARTLIRPPAWPLPSVTSPVGSMDDPAPIAAVPATSDQVTDCPPEPTPAGSHPPGSEPRFGVVQADGTHRDSDGLALHGHRPDR